MKIPYVFIAAFFLSTGVIFTESKPLEIESSYIVYYFHHQFRCDSCNSIESLTRASVLGGVGENSKYKTRIEIKSPFENLVKEKRISFVLVNVDLEENKHFIQEYGEIAQLPLIVEIKNGKSFRHAVLDQVWQRLPNNKEFMEYVQKTCAAFINPMLRKGSK